MTVIVTCLSCFVHAQDSLVNASACKKIVEILAADSFLGRHPSMVTAQQAARFIASEFSKAGCLPGAAGGSFFMPFQISWDGESKTTENVIGILPGKSKPHEWVVFSAHYDHIGTKKTNLVGGFVKDRSKPEVGDSIYNGANDNAPALPR